MVAGLVLAFVGQKNFAACSEVYSQDKILKIGSKNIEAQVAKTRDELAKGLGGRECLGKNQAMLFEFSRQGNYSFWMKDMKFPLDIVWLNSDKKVVDVKENILPSTYPKSFGGDQPAQYVLELQVGRARQLKIAKDTTISF